MFNRANKRFKNTLTTGSTADDVRAEPGQFDPLLGDGEGVHHVCSSTEGFEHETDDRTTTLEPGGDADAHLLVTDRRVLGVLDTDTTDPEFDFDAREVSRATGRDGLLSATLELATAEETVRFEPDDGTDVERVAATVDRIATAWADLHEALNAVETAMAEYENRVADGVDPDAALTNVRSRLSRAHHCATKDEYTPEEEMLAEIEPIEDEVDQLRVTARLDRAEELLDDAESALADASASAIETAIDGALEAATQIADAREVHGEVGSTAISQRVRDLTERLDEICAEILADAENACAAASAAETPAESLSRWETAQEQYRAMLDAGWDGEASVGAEAIRYQLAWVVGNRVDTLRERAERLEAEGDDAADGEIEADEAEKFEAALDSREEAREIEAECPFGEPSGDADAIERLEDKIARAEWQWGQA